MLVLSAELASALNEFLKTRDIETYKGVLIDR